jgi:phosphate:Na+ symporter
MVKDVSAGLRESKWIIEFVEFASEAGIIGFLIGVIVTLITQSSASVTILAVTLNLAGILPFSDTVILVTGSSVGSGLSVVLATSHLHARQRKLSMYQCMVKLIGVSLFFPLGWLGQQWFKEILPSWINDLSVSTWIALIYLALQIIGALAASLLQGRLMILLDLLCPATEQEALFEPRYIYSEASEDADTALILALREQDRLLATLSDYLDPIRPETEVASTSIPLPIRHAAAGLLAEKIRLFMEETVIHNRSDTAIERIFSLQCRNETIISLQDSLNSFVVAIQATNDPQAGWASSMVEGLHLILTILRDTLAEGAEESDLLFALTLDRGQLMDKIRESLLTGNTGNFADRQSVFVSTGIFERIIWLIRQIAISRFSTNQYSPVKNLPDYA